MSGLVQKYPLLLFLGLTYMSAWAFWIPAVFSSQDLWKIEIPFWRIGFFSPSICGLILTFLGKGKRGTRKLLRSLMEWRVGIRWYLVILLLPMVIVIIPSFSLYVLFGGKLLFEAPTPWYSIVPSFVGILFLGGPLSEEIGWRGYALPRMLKGKSALSASILLGILWSLWHLPLFWIVESSQCEIPLLWFILEVVALSVLFTWVFMNTKGSLLLVILLHSTFNSALTLIQPAFMKDLDRTMVLLVITLWLIVLLVVFIKGPSRLSSGGTNNL